MTSSTQTRSTSKSINSCTDFKISAAFLPKRDNLNTRTQEISSFSQEMSSIISIKAGLPLMLISVAHRHAVAVHKIYRNHQSAPTRRTTKKTAPKFTLSYAVSIAQKDRQPQKTTAHSITSPAAVHFSPQSLPEPHPSDAPSKSNP